jgi:hypothetical protein
MQVIKSGIVLAMALGAASCGQGGSGNVMSSSNANSLTPEQVDLALGNEVNSAADANAVTNEGADEAQTNSTE